MRELRHTRLPDPKLSVTIRGGSVASVNLTAQSSRPFRDAPTVALVDAERYVQDASGNLVVALQGAPAAGVTVAGMTRWWTGRRPDPRARDGRQRRAAGPVRRERLHRSGGRGGGLHGLVIRDNTLSLVVRAVDYIAAATALPAGLSRVRIRSHAHLPVLHTTGRWLQSVTVASAGSNYAGGRHTRIALSSSNASARSAAETGIGSVLRPDGRPQGVVSVRRGGGGAGCFVMPLDPFLRQADGETTYKLEQRVAVVGTQEKLTLSARAQTPTHWSARTWTTRRTWSGCWRRNRCSWWRTTRSRLPTTCRHRHQLRRQHSQRSVEPGRELPDRDAHPYTRWWASRRRCGSGMRRAPPGP